MIVKTICLKCGQPQRINFANVSFVEALAALNKLDKPGECPGGYHVELSGWSTLWQFGACLVLVYGAEAEQSAQVQGMLACAKSYREERKLAYRPEPELEVEAAVAKCGFQAFGMMPPCTLNPGHEGDHADGFGGHYGRTEGKELAQVEGSKELRYMEKR